MKILMLSDLNSIHTKKWVSGLSEHGIEILVFGFIAPSDNFYDKLENVQIQYGAALKSSRASLRSKLGYLKHFRKLKRACKSFKPDIIHAHYASSYGLLASFLGRHPLLISMWGSDIFDFPKANRLNRIILERNFKNADYLFSTSHAMAIEAKKYTSKNINVVPFGVNLNQFSKQERATTPEIVIGIVKTLEPNYGIRFLIAAFKILKDDLPNQSLRLIIAGEGSEEQALKDQVKSLGLQKHVAFRGYIKNDKVAACFNQMDIAVIPSLEESFGVSAVEAAACELPVVATRVGGLPEVIIEGVTGLLCEPGNVEDLTAKLKKLILSADLRMKMGKEGRKYVLSQYNWNENVQLMVEHYKSIQKNNR